MRFGLRSSRKLLFDCDFRANFSTITIFHCNLRANLSILIRTFLRLQSSCDLAICLARNFWLQSSRELFFGLVWTLSLLDFLLRSDAVFLSFFWTIGVFFGRCGNVRGSFGRSLFWWLFTLSLSVFLRTFRLFALSLSDYAVSFGLFTRFWTVYYVSFGFSFCSDAVAYLGHGSFGLRLFRMMLPRFFFGCRLFRMLFLLDADALLRTRMLFFGQGCLCFSERGCSSSDASAPLLMSILSLGAAVSSDEDSCGGVFPTFTRVPWYTYLAI